MEQYKYGSESIVSTGTLPGVSEDGILTDPNHLKGLSLKPYDPVTSGILASKHHPNDSAPYVYSPVIKKKHRGYILAIDKAYVVNKLEFSEGFSNDCSLPYFLGGLVKGDKDLYPEGHTGDIYSHLIIAERHALEQDFGKVQPLNYVVITQQQLKTGPDRHYWENYYSLYFRQKGGGEKELEERKSLGYGGHTQRASVVWETAPENTENEYPDFLATALNNLRQELDEELHFKLPLTEQRFELSEEYLSQNLKLKGFIWDPSDKVGKVHLALVWELEIPDYVYLESAEGEQMVEGFMNLPELLEQAKELDGKLIENWSKIVINAIAGGSWDLDVWSLEFGWTDAAVFERAAAWITAANRDSERQTAEAEGASSVQALLQRQHDEEHGDAQAEPFKVEFLGENGEPQATFENGQRTDKWVEAIDPHAAFAGSPSKSPDPGLVLSDRMQLEVVALTSDSFEERFKAWAAISGWTADEIAGFLEKFKEDAPVFTQAVEAPREAFEFHSDKVLLQLGALQFTYMKYGEKGQVIDDSTPQEPAYFRQRLHALAKGAGWSTEESMALFGKISGDREIALEAMKAPKNAFDMTDAYLALTIGTLVVTYTRAADGTTVKVNKNHITSAEAIAKIEQGLRG